jgi:hypothetical protein
MRKGQWVAAGQRGKVQGCVGTEDRGLAMGGLSQQDSKWWKHHKQVGKGVRLQGQRELVVLLSL